MAGMKKNGRPKRGGPGPAPFIAGALALAGFSCLALKTYSAEYVDSSGLLHENFFLLPVGFFLLICAAAVAAVCGIKIIIIKIKSKKNRP
jgi:hypothetical protein